MGMQVIEHLSVRVTVCGLLVDHFVRILPISVRGSPTHPLTSTPTYTYIHRDGCDMGKARCQPGYYCANGNMTICPPGTWRSLNYSQVGNCNLCEKVGWSIEAHSRPSIMVNELLHVDAPARDPTSFSLTMNLSPITRLFFVEQGRYRAMFGGTSMESCTKCPQGTYVNVTGATSNSQCLRCPDGKFGPEPG